MTEMLLQSHAGAIHVLPALPDAWSASGGVSGLRAYGGFELDFSWQNGAVSELVIRSALGGNARIRVPNELTSSAGEPLAAATGDNPNSYFATAQVKPPIVSPAADLNEVVLDPTFVFDLATEAGRSYRLVAKQ
jgi:alpha-L-fucosidase 2